VTTKVFMDLMILVTTISRAFSLLVDPHYTKEILSPFVVGIVYGLPYPALNAAIGLMLLVLYEQLAASRQLRGGKGNGKFLPNTIKVFVTMTVLQFATQIFADAMRAASYSFPILMICKVYFILWGFVVCCYAAVAGRKLWKILSIPLRKRAYKFFLNVYTSAAIGMVMLSSSAVLLLYDLSDTEYFAEQIFMRIIEILACVLFLHAVVATHQLSITLKATRSFQMAKRASGTLRRKSSAQLDHFKSVPANLARRPSKSNAKGTKYQVDTLGLDGIFSTPVEKLAPNPQESPVLPAEGEPATSRTPVLG